MFNDLLHQLLRLRSPLQYPAEETQASYLVTTHNASLGHCDDVHGLRAQLLRITGSEMVPWSR